MNSQLREIGFNALVCVFVMLIFGGWLGWHIAMTVPQHIAAVVAAAVGFIGLKSIGVLDRSNNVAAPTNTQLQNPPPAIEEVSTEDMPANNSLERP
jgi:hypothetical protein